MSIQSISVVVPTKACVNNCKFCVSKMHNNPYEDKFDEIAYRKRIKRAKIENVSTLIITGTGEALQNIPFLLKLRDVLAKERHPFPNVELQTSGVMIMKKLPRGENKYPNVNILKELGVNTISLSVSDIFSSKNNWDIIGAHENLRENLDILCKFIKDEGFNLRLSLNMTNVYNDYKPLMILKRCKELGADQITFRELYGENNETPEGIWVKENACKFGVIEGIETYIAGGYEKVAHGKKGFKLPFGAWVYSIMGMSVAIDSDCMAKEEVGEDMKYVILRENGKLYWSWDDEGSLIF